MKKKLSIIIVIVLLFISYIYINSSSLDTKFFNLGKNYKNAIEKSTAIGSEKTDYITINSQINISYDSLYEELNLLSVNNKLDDRELAEQAINEVIQHEVMVSYVESLGYKITEKDYEDYKKSLIDSIKEADNYDEILKYFEGFGGINEYFKKMEHRLKNNLLIRKYLDDEMIKYANSKGYDVIDIEFVEIWRQKENEIIQEQVRKSNISEKKKEELLNVALDYISKEAK